MPSCKILIPWNLTIGDWAMISDSVVIDNHSMVTIGDLVVVSQEVYLCTGSHDIKDPYMPLIHSPIAIMDYSWICARAFIGPGVTVNEGAVVGACAVVVRDVQDWSVSAGNPARFIKKRELRQIET
jgi:putative colanic acid biosynthesis acetyltransferase WcaF